MANKRSRFRVLIGVSACMLLALPAGPALSASSFYAPGEVERDANGEPVILAQADTGADAHASAATGNSEEIKDPFEHYNRFIFKLNNGVDKVLLKPIAKAYRWALPGFVRRGITNGFNNLQEPFTFVNALLQGKGGVAMKSLGRFLINSTVGVAGLNDQASQWGVKRQEEDFGQTLGVWGIGDGPFLMLPFFGPSNPRDLVGFIAERFGSPANFVQSRYLANAIDYSLSGVQIVDLRARALDSVDKLLETSSDPYIALRSAYIQQRRFQVHDGESSITIPTDDEFLDDTAPPAPQNSEQQVQSTVQEQAVASAQDVQDPADFNPELRSDCFSE